MTTKPNSSPSILLENDAVPYQALVAGKWEPTSAGAIKHYLRAYGDTPWPTRPAPISAEARALVIARLNHD